MGIGVKGWARSFKNRFLRTITRFDVCAPVAALTFDDGPHAEFTPRALALLKKYDAKATFFMVGESARRMPELVRKVAADGHTIGNHTLDHVSMASTQRKDRLRQILEAEWVLAPFAKPLFRPPWGHQTEASRLDLFFLRYKVICWNVEVSDWSETSAERMASQLISKTQPGSVILLHDAILTGNTAAEKLAVHSDRGAMFCALELFLDHMKGKVRFVTIPEMFKLGKPVGCNWIHGPPPVVNPLKQGIALPVNRTIDRRDTFMGKDRGQSSTKGH